MSRHPLGERVNDQEKLLYLCGVASEFLNYSGERCVVPQDDRLRLLRLAGHSIDSPAAVAEEIFELDVSHWLKGLKAVSVTSADARVSLYNAPELLAQRLHWEVLTEQGQQHHGSVIPRDLAECGEYHYNGTRYSARELPLGKLALGYHTLRIRQDSREITASLIVCPVRAFDVATDNRANDKLWGISCQLYSLRSARNWGVGDFADLRELITLAAAEGADIVGINPLHALCSTKPDSVSPYSPSDRRFLNPLYIALDEVAEYQQAPSIRTLSDAADFQVQLRALRDLDWVDHHAVCTLKYQILELAFSEFLSRHSKSESARGREFEAFVVEQGEALQQFADFEQQHNIYARQHRADGRFYCYLQWLARQQLEACQHTAIAAGMRIGLMGDFAVGAVAEGCEVSANASLYVSACSVGAPPDAYSSEGQNWGLPAMDPVALRRNRYHNFIDLMRANMRGVGALRIDHVMSLQRLWWCFPIEAGAQSKGVYVYYPMQDLLSILCLESQRNRCLIVGEDLGVVSPEVRQAMQQCGLYGNDLFYFTQYLDGRFWPLAERRREALLAVTSHDVPTLFDWWSEQDITRRFELGVIKALEERDELYRQRERDKRHLLQWLAHHQLLPPDRQDADLRKPMDMALCESVHRACARSTSRLMLLQLEDLQLLQAPINIPATSQEYPNWRRKQGLNTVEIFAREEAKRVLAAVAAERPR